MAWKRLETSLGIGLASTLACGGASPGADASGSSGVVAGTSGSMSASTSSSDSTGASTVDPSTGPGVTTEQADDGGDTIDPPVDFDLGGIPDAAVIDEFGCQGVDFLFVVDNSGSMTNQQAQLLASFPGFITAIEASLENVDSYHVGVVTSDNYAGNEPGCNTLGDLVTQTAGFGSSNEVCGPFASGLRFATDEDDLQSVFPCMAQVGTTGSPIEQPASATVAALDPAKAEPGACNEGFLREDAILVVVVVTDDPPNSFDFDDAHANTDTSGWYDAVVAAKGGVLESVVMIGFVPWNDLSCTFAESPNLIGFIESFGKQGVLASICEPDYGPVFASTVETIQTTCDNFEPPG